MLLCAACAQRTPTEEPVAEPVTLVTVDTTREGLVIYCPPTDSVELRCFDRPVPEEDGSVVFCCAAAFTADFGNEADHARIRGDHVSDGRHYQRPRLGRNTGAFVVGKDGRYDFLYSPSADPSAFRPSFRNAATGFTQEMMIHQGAKVKTTRPDGNNNQFRALCLIDGKLCVADAEASMPFGTFIDLLLAAGASEAIYMDMGPGWNYSWYREYADSAANFIHSWPIESATNWLVFHRK